MHFNLHWMLSFSICLWPGSTFWATKSPSWLVCGIILKCTGSLPLFFQSPLSLSLVFRGMRFLSCDLAFYSVWLTLLESLLRRAEFAHFGAEVVVGEGLCVHTLRWGVWVHHSCGTWVTNFYLLLFFSNKLWGLLLKGIMRLSLCLVLILLWAVRCVCLVLGAVLSSAMTFFL